MALAASAALAATKDNMAQLVALANAACAKTKAVSSRGPVVRLIAEQLTRQTFEGALIPMNKLKKIWSFWSLSENQHNILQSCQRKVQAAKCPNYLPPAACSTCGSDRSIVRCILANTGAARYATAGERLQR